MNKNYLFDWDDNILHMNTKIYVEKIINKQWKKCKVSTSKFAKIRHSNEYRPFSNSWQKAFEEFTDNGSRGDTAFLMDVNKALKKTSFGPSYSDFVECLTQANFFGIVTARGHHERILIESIKFLIEKTFTHYRYSNMIRNIRLKYLPKELRHILSADIVLDRYLRRCHYYCVSSERFTEYIKNASLPVEEAKKLAIKMFISKVVNIDPDSKIGFSDDDSNNVKHISEYVSKELKKEYPELEFNIYDTSTKKKVKL